MGKGMYSFDTNSINRRQFCRMFAAGYLGLASGYPIQAKEPQHYILSSFSRKNWQDYFSNLNNGAILVEIEFRMLHFWSEDETEYWIYPTSVPISPELTRLGTTKVIGKKKNPSWRPTPQMLERNPDWPVYIPPGPKNPLGTHALYLTWEYYRIHGTHDHRKIGYESSNGCIGLYNGHIAQLYELSNIGTQVLLI